MRASDLRYRTENAERVRELVNARAKRWRENNRQKINDERKRRFQANKDAEREWHRKWREEHPEHWMALRTNRVARNRAAEGKFTGEDVARIKRQQRGKCALCKTKLMAYAALDHIVALSNGGSNWPRNLQWLCRSCNSKKNALDPLEYSKLIGLLL